MTSPPPPSSPAPATSDAALALLRAAINEIKSVAHDPAMVHAIAERMKHGIDVLANAIADDPQKKTDEGAKNAGGPNRL